ncbi:DUF5123 domain-containing protein [Bacteroides sp.]
MKKHLLLAMALVAGITSIKAQAVSTAEDYANAVKTGSGDITITIPANTDIVLAEGTEVSANITGISIIGADNTSVLTVGNSGTLSIGSDLTKVEFKNLKVRATYATVGESGTGYILNLSKACTINSLSIDNCEADSIRGILRTQSKTIAIKDVTINNCIMHNIGSYNVINLHTDGSIETLNITNNTMYDYNHSSLSNIIGIKTAGSITNLKFSNNTVYNYCCSGKYIADLAGDNSLTGTFEFKNNLFGKGYSTEKIKSFKGTIAGADYADSATNYATSDLVFNGASEKAYFTILSGSTSSIFADPENGDFTIAQDQEYSNAGAPRWNGQTVGISSTNVAKEIVSTEYYNIVGVKLNEPAKGLNIVKNIMSDGSVESNKVFIK